MIFAVTTFYLKPWVIPVSVRSQITVSLLKGLLEGTTVQAIEEGVTLAAVLRRFCPVSPSLCNATLTLLLSAKIIFFKKRYIYVVKIFWQEQYNADPYCPVNVMSNTGTLKVVAQCLDQMRRI